MTTLHEMAEALMAAEGLTRQPRTLDELPEIRDELPEIRDQHREALASIPTPVAPDDRL